MKLRADIERSKEQSSQLQKDYFEAIEILNLDSRLFLVFDEVTSAASIDEEFTDKL